MHERRRPERRIVDQAAAQQQRRPSERPLVGGRQPHEEVVRVLIVDERRALERLAGLKHLGRTEVAQRERLERQHAVQRQRARRRLAALPIPINQFCDSTWLKSRNSRILEVGGEKRARVERPRPAGRRRGIVMFVLSGNRGRNEDGGNQDGQRARNWWHVTKPESNANPPVGATAVPALLDK